MEKTSIEIQKKPNVRITVNIVLGFALFIVLWYIFVLILQLSYNGISVVPFPHEAFKSFFILFWNPVDGVTLLEHVGASLFRVFIGVLYAFIIAIPLGIAIAVNPFLDGIIKPIIEMIRPIPPIAWIPFAIITFGLTTTSHAFIIFMGAFFPLLQNIYDGVRQSSKVYQDVAKSLGASRSQIAWDVILPSILPSIITGLRVAIGVGWMCVIAAEMMGISGAGIGYFINYMKNIGNYSNMVAGMLMIAIIGLLINGVFVLIENYALKWRLHQ
ncbi:ABC transporter permease [Promethearchaeum syntrophicum]|uniref:ABC transporter permease n=1 Tax=Promethearchaeum syntrophicum TaxID=2594042 RepID=A0A5B9D8Q8_9ARCH|nr:ABC transporter permease [Candidatus Prometheoarchaeum syntrophicum]QEE15529.1 taurine transporter subunit [Candidatus Prometheoarchaeum syntrophicum]